jgi:hypothetical protein
MMNMSLGMKRAHFIVTCQIEGLNFEVIFVAQLNQKLRNFTPLYILMT